ncbi:MAG TPA: hypothetical protein VN380_26605 [Thermoanaerobaculia bacterium]|nr:hypothetical protein [Thermoanaerobaculia bacterium]
MKKSVALAFLVLFPVAASAQSATPPPQAPWQFVVAGDSRNCGDVVMPAIAAAASKDGAKFYWHLGDWRAIYTFDQDMVQAATMAGKSLQLQSYLFTAFQDAIDNQLKPFEKKGISVYVGIGNHETIWPMTRKAFVNAFRGYLDMPAIRDQRAKDDPYTFQPPVQTYYHVVKDGIDFITLDNGSCDMFDPQQMSWLTALLDRDAADAKIKTVVVGMHEALPDSRSCGHSMSNYPRQRETGRRVYHLLLDLRDKHQKQVYVLASHSHFVMENVYDTDYWRANGGVLTGWIVGTSGAVRYELPDGVTPGPNTKTGVYGYLLGTVSANGSIAFTFRELTLSDIPDEVITKYSKSFVEDVCFKGNRDPTKQKSSCPPMSQCSAGSD